MGFWLVYWIVIGMIMCIGLAIQRFDRIVVFLMKLMHIYAYPTAIGIAMLITERPEQWSASTHHMIHPDIGSIWTANDAYGLYIETQFGKWVPNRIERRIIRDAVDWRISQYIRNRLEAAQTKALRGDRH